MQIIGSQRRETLKESGYKLVGREQGAVILEDKDGKREIWYANDDHAGYTIQVGRWGYEFGSDYPPTPLQIIAATEDAQVEDAKTHPRNCTCFNCSP